MVAAPPQQLLSQQYPPPTANNAPPPLPSREPPRELFTPVPAPDYSRLPPGVAASLARLAAGGKTVDSVAPPQPVDPVTAPPLTKTNLG